MSNTEQIVIIVVLLFIIFFQFWYIVSKFLNSKKSIQKPFIFSFLKSQKKEGDSIMLVYSVSVGAVVDADVTKRNLSVQVNGNVEYERSYGFDVTDFGEHKFNQGDLVVLTLVDVDDAGNRSEPAVLEFVANDTIPPTTPSVFGVSLLREEEDAPAPVDDVPPDPTDPETEA